MRRLALLGRPVVPALDPKTATVWAAEPDPSVLTEISEKTNRVIHRYTNLPGSAPGFGGVATDSRTGRVWVSTFTTLDEISEARHRVVRVVSITPNNFWTAITIDPRHKIALIGDGDNLLTVSETSGKILRKVRLSTMDLADALSDIRVDLSTRTVYVSLLWDNAVAVLKE